MHPIYMRLGELWTINQKRQLNEKELREFNDCLRLNNHFCWEAAYVEAVAMMDSMVRDVNYEDEIILDDN